MGFRVLYGYMRIYQGYIGIYRDSRKENRSYYLGFREFEV